MLWVRNSRSIELFSKELILSFLLINAVTHFLNSKTSLYKRRKSISRCENHYDILRKRKIGTVLGYQCLHGRYFFAKQKKFWYYVIVCWRRVSLNSLVFGKEFNNSYCICFPNLLTANTNRTFQLREVITPSTSPGRTTTDRWFIENKSSKTLVHVDRFEQKLYLIHSFIVNNPERRSKKRL